MQSQTVLNMYARKRAVSDIRAERAKLREQDMIKRDELLVARREVQDAKNEVFEEVLQTVTDTAIFKSKGLHNWRDNCDLCELEWANAAAELTLAINRAWKAKVALLRFYRNNRNAPRNVTFEIDIEKLMRREGLLPEPIPEN